MKERYLVDLDLREDVELIVDTVKRIDLDMIKVQDLLNEQDEKIKELGGKHLLSEAEWKHYCSFKRIEPQIKGCLDRENALIKENQQLKQSQNNKAIEELGKVLKFINDSYENYYPEPYQIKILIEHQLSELGGKYEK